MLDWGDKVRDHFFNPRNAGTLADANAVGEAGSLAGGDALKLMLRINDQTQIIEDARFLALGGGSAIAAYSALTELVIGLTVAAAQAIAQDDIASALGGLPPDQMHGPRLGHVALARACAGFLGAAADLPAPAVRRSQPPAALGYAARLARGGAPVPLSSHPLFARRKLQAVEPTEDITPPAKDDDATTTAIRRVIDELRPVFLRDGGDIRLVRVEAAQVFVHLSGACAGCMLAGQTLAGLHKRIIEVLGRPMRVIPADRGLG